MDISRKLEPSGNPCTAMVNRVTSFFTVAIVVCLTGCTNNSDEDEQLENTFFLMNLPANRWIEYHHLEDGEWWRKGHAGMAYDAARGSLLVFGSDTHGEDWDNVAHEFIPNQREWVHHGVNSDSSTYRLNDEGQRVAGVADLAPWAMHTYDGVEYDSLRDNLIVVASPSHNPVGKQIPGPKSDAIWLYNLSNKKWSIFDNRGGNAPGNYFGAATAYDKTSHRFFYVRRGYGCLNSKVRI